MLLGDPADFSVDAEPWLYLSYQWNFKGKPLSGATGAWLDLTNVGPAQAGIYTVSLSTGGKAVVSQKALLTIVKPVLIKTEPRSQTVKAGKSVAFSVGVLGTGPFTYQWYWNSDAITNATKSFYAISKVKTANAGSYAVVVGNGLSSAVSSNAVLTINP